MSVFVQDNLKHGHHHDRKLHHQPFTESFTGTVAKDLVWGILEMGDPQDHWIHWFQNEIL